MIYRLTYLCISTLYLRSYERAGRGLRSATTWGILLQVPTVRILQPACLPAAFAFILVIQQTRGRLEVIWQRNANASMGHGQSLQQVFPGQGRPPSSRLRHTRSLVWGVCNESDGVGGAVWKNCELESAEVE